MAVIFVCDACGKREPGTHNGLSWLKPSAWFTRTTKDGKTILTACSRGCVERINTDRGEHTAVIPL